MANAASVGAKTVSWRCFESVATTAGSAARTAATRVLNSPGSAFEAATAMSTMFADGAVRAATGPATMPMASAAAVTDRTRRRTG